ncbi:MAG: vanadium-dependent haloperoxidase [Acidobacteriota bacterium]
MSYRRRAAEDVRRNAADLAASRVHPHHCNNGEEFLYRDDDNQPTHLASFSKGLSHDTKTGLLANARDYQLFVLGIQSGDTADFERTPLGPASPPQTAGCASDQKITCDTLPKDRVECWQSFIARNTRGPSDAPGVKADGAGVRAWESAGAGLTFDLEGPDAQAVTMPPAPRLDSAELAAEMAEVYWMALLRDTPFSEIENPGANPSVQAAFDFLKGLPWFDANQLDDDALSDAERSRRRPRLDASGGLPANALFRGQTPGEGIGPYISQFLLVGNGSLGSAIDGNANDALRTALGHTPCPFGPDAGRIAYGAITIDQRVRVATPGRDYMTTWEAWLDVQNGADVRGVETYECKPARTRFLYTPRDLATYVHYDALYEAYLNACLILLGAGVPFDHGIPFFGPDVEDKQQGFAQFGGPHILSLVCEVATRALKAVRYQKFNIHRRLRPEAVGGRLEAVRRKADGNFGPIVSLEQSLEGLLKEVKKHNREQNRADDRKDDKQTPKDQRNRRGTHLLPMAFPEGSPMHPSYGAGHATVAAACVTVLKAFFDHGHELDFCYRSTSNGDKLMKDTNAPTLTVEGELNKLAANISIGRNWAGVHYYTDYIESMRMGERVAIGLLEEQKLTYGENFSLTVPLFDGGALQI